MGSLGQAEEPSWWRNDHIRLWAALAVSLSLHLVVIAFLVAFIPSSRISPGQWAGLPDATLTVSIAKPESRGQPVAHTFRQFASTQAPRDSKANFAARNPAQGGINSSRYNIGFPDIYFPTSELDVIPIIQRDIDLYPPELHSFKHGGGKAVLRLWIDETGHVTKAEPVNSDLPAIFAEVAARVFLQAGFLPGRKNGLAVKSRVETVLLYPSRDSNR